MKYSMERNPDKSAKAFGVEMHCSPKHSENIARLIRGMEVKKAKKILEEIISLKSPVPFKTHNKKLAHRAKIGPGAYPEKAAKNILKIIKNAENNAEYKGLDVDEMFISHISAYRGEVVKGTIPRAHGRATDKNEQTTNLEVIIEEK
jgi:large subunit ribosomal protein L22